MFTTGVYNPIPTGYQYPTQPPVPAPVYPTQYNGFYPQTTAPLRGQSVPAANRQYPPSSSRPYGQYPPVPPATQQTYQSTKSRRKRSKKRTPTPDEIADHSLYSDKEKNERSRSPSPIVQGDNVSTKQEDINGNEQEHEQQSQASAEQSQGPANPPKEQAQASSPPKEKRKSRSKKKRHHHRHRYEQVDVSYVPPPPPPPLPTQPPSAYFGALPPQMRVHQQPLYTSYNQAYEESIRRGDVYQKQAKRSTRLPPEAKQQLLPHEDDNKKPYLYTNYPQPTYNPYQGNFYSTQAPVYNVPPPRPPSQAWPQVPPAEQEIQRLRSHIHTLEGELHKLQKKLTKTTIHHDHHSPRQTPLIVELNNQPNGSLHLENEGKPSKSSREETAAQLAHAAAAHVHARQQVPVPPPPPPPPPPSSSTAAAAAAVGPSYPQQRNYNQSNNNDDIDRKDDDERQRRSADKILDAFERFYMSKSSAAPMKVKYIPEDSQTNQQKNTNNNNNNDLIRDRSSSLSN